VVHDACGNGSMRLSILVPTNRTGLSVCAKIAQACSWATPDIEVIIRDNSGDMGKREFLIQCQREHCKILIAEPCSYLVNLREILRASSGDFVFFVADDDFCFDYAIGAVSNLIGQTSGDLSISGIAGYCVVETTQGSSILSYQNVDSVDVTERLIGYLKLGGPNVLYYAPVRREVAQRVYAFVGAMPAMFSFHDQIICLLCLLNGRYIRLNRLLYLYDLGVWENVGSSQKRDVEFYVREGFDAAMSQLHWFLCGFEGAVLARNGRVFPDLSLSKRQTVTDLWFSLMFARFKHGERIKFESRFGDQADRTRDKLLKSTGRLLFPDMLKELCDFIALFSAGKAQAYHDFWDAVINNRGPDLQAEISTATQAA
jgi:hypothetical protein